MRPLRVFVLYEHGSEFQPWCTGHIRLLRPLGHPSVRGQVELHAGRRFDGGRYDAVIVERLWRSVISLAAVEQLIDEVRRSGSPLLYSVDDNLLDLAGPEEGREIFRRLARAAIGVLVSAEALRDRIAHLNGNVAVVPNALDERLLVHVATTPESTPFPRRRLRIGYMGTHSHDADLRLIAPALRSICERHPDAVEIELLGVVKRQRTLECLRGLRLRVVAPPPGQDDYPLFMLWYTSRVRWDVGLAPLLVDAYTSCKSDIKLLDYAAIGAVGVYSRIAPYEPLRDGQMGLVVDENDTAGWTAAIEALLTDEALRRAMRDRARAHLFGERTLTRAAARWPAAIEALLDGARRGP